MPSRQEFIALGALIAAAFPSLADAAVAAPQAPAPKLDFDLAAFDASLAGAGIKHKHLFASKAVDDGGVFGTMHTVMRAYASIGTPADVVLPVAVLYHYGALLGFGDASWNDYITPALAKMPKAQRDALGAVVKPGSGNPWKQIVKSAGDFDSSIDGALALAPNARFYVCNNALMGMSDEIAKLLGREHATVYDALARDLIPNGMLVPAGVWAVHAVQERGYTLLQTSL
ncbi:MAG: hypothetical protein KGN02_07275 [bacterium]|nr:hypothetical protein [bacterium]